MMLLIDTVPEGAAGDFGHGEPEGLLVEGVGPGGFGGQGDHFLEAGVEGPAAAGVVPGEDPGLLAAVPAGAGGGADEVGEGFVHCLRCRV